VRPLSGKELIKEFCSNSIGSEMLELDWLLDF
jgi:hypothetical protein